MNQAKEMARLAVDNFAVSIVVVVETSTKEYSVSGVSPPVEITFTEIGRASGRERV